MGKKQLSTETAKGVESFYSIGGILKARLTAPNMIRHLQDSSYVEFPNSLHVDFYNDTTKQIESRLDALYGKYREYEQKIFLKDSVVSINITKGDTLHCDELWWDRNTQSFYTDKKVRINTKDKIIYGTGMKAAQNFSWYVIDHPRGSLLVPENGLPK